MATAGSIVVDLLARTGSFETDINRARKRVGDFDNDLRGMVARLDRASLAFAGVAAGAVAGFAAITMQSVKAMDATAKMAEQIGTTTEALTGLRFSAQQFANVSDQTFDMSLRRMTRRIQEAAEGSGAAKGALDDLGLSAKNLARMAPDRQFLAIADAVQKTDAQAQRLRATMAIFDTEGMPLVNALQQGSGELEKNIQLATRYGLVLSTHAAKSAAQLSDNLSRLASVQSGLRQQLATALLPALERASGYMLTAAESALQLGDSRSVLDGFGRAAVAAVDDLARSYAGLVEIAGGVKDLFAALDDAAASWLEPFQAQTEGAANILQQSFSESVLNTAREIDKLVGFAGGVMAVWEAVGHNIPAYFDLAWAGVLRGAAEFVNSLADIVNPMLTTLGMDALVGVDWGKDAAVAIRSLTEAYEQGAVAARLAVDMTGRVQAAFDGVAASAAAASGSSGSSGGGGGGVAGLAKSTQSLLDRLLPTRKALADLHKGLVVLESAYKSGIITAHEYDQALLSLNSTYAKAYNEALPEHIRKLDEQLSKLRDQERELTKSVRVFGMADSAATRLAASETRVALAKVETTRATEAQNGASQERLAVLDEEIARLGQLADTQERVAALQGSQERLEAVKKNNEEILGEWRRVTQQIEQSLTDRIFQGGISGKELLLDLFKGVTLRVLVQPIVGSIMGTVGSAMGVPGLGNAQGQDGGIMSSLLGAGGQGTGAMGMISTARSVYNMLGDGMTSSLASGIGALGETFGSSALQSMAAGMRGATLAPGLMGPTTAGATGAMGFGAGMASTSSWAAASSAIQSGSAAQIGGLALGTLGNAFAGYGISKGLSGGYSAGKWVDYAAAIASAIPGVGPIAGVVGALINRAFGKGAKEIVASGLQGRLDAGAGHTVVEKFDDWSQKGGWFSSGDKGTLRYYQEETTQAFRKGIEETFRSIGEYGKIFGLQFGNLSQYQRDFKLSGDDAGEQLQRMLEGFLKDVIRWEFGDALGPVARDGEDLGDTLVRLGEAIHTVNPMLENLGHQMYAVSLAGADMSSQLLDLFGGGEAMAAVTGRWYELYYTDAEKAARATEMLTREFAGLGYSLPASREQLREWVEAQDLTTHRGREVYVSLMAMGEAFAAVDEINRNLNREAEEEARRHAEEMQRIAEERNRAIEAAYSRYQDTYFSEAEKAARLTAQVTEQFAALGLSLPDSRDELRAWIETQEQAGEGGRELRDSLLLITDAYAEMDEANRALADAATQAAQQVAQAAEQAAQASYQAWISQQQQAWGVIRNESAAALAALSRSIGAERTRLQTEADEIAQALNGAIDLSRTSLQSLTSLSDRLGSTLSGMLQQQGDAGINRAWAQDQIERALSTALLTGQMPQGREFEDALQVVSRPSEGLFGSFEDYQSDFLRTAHDIRRLGEITDDQVSIEQRTLDSLTEQLDTSQAWYAAEMSRLDTMLDLAQQDLEQAMGTHRALLSIDESAKWIAAALQSAQQFAQGAPGLNTPFGSGDPAIDTLQHAYQSWFDNNPVGHSMGFAGGQIIQVEKGQALWIGPDGQRHSFGRNQSVEDVASLAPSIAEQWMREFGVSLGVGGRGSTGAGDNPGFDDNAYLAAKASALNRDQLDGRADWT